MGIQTGYDPNNEEVADFMYCGEELIETGADEVVHTRSLVLGEIRADCEVCFDSERLKTKEVGRYSSMRLRSRLCEHVEVRGPGLTPRGLSTESKVTSL